MTPVPPTKKGRIPIEPLGERRWNAVRERVLVDAPLARAEARLEARPPIQRGPWIVAAVAVAAAAVVMVRAMPSGPSAALGSERVVTGDEPSYATAGDVRITVGAHGSVHAIEVEPDRWVVSVEHGEAHFEVPPRHGRPDFVVDAGQTHVVVIGTAFTVAREGGASTGTVSVDHGRVQVSERGVEHVLTGGERWPTLHAEATEALVAPVADEPAVEASVGPERVVTEDPTRTHASRRDPAQASTPVAAPAPTSAPPAPRPHAASRFAEAQRLERDEPVRALALYAAIADEGGAWGANALYAEGRLEADLHHGPRARSLLQRYLAEHPDGPNAEDATDLLRSLP